MAWFQQKVVAPILGFLKQGVEPSKLAWAISAGLIIAIIPVFGASTLVCFVAIWMFRLNPGALLLANQLAYPLQFILYIPFLKAGGWLFGGAGFSLTFAEVAAMVKADVLSAIGVLWWSTMRGLVVWVAIAIPVAYLIQFALKLLLSKVVVRAQGQE